MGGGNVEQLQVLNDLWVLVLWLMRMTMTMIIMIMTVSAKIMAPKFQEEGKNDWEIKSIKKFQIGKEEKGSERKYFRNEGIWYKELKRSKQDRGRVHIRHARKNSGIREQEYYRKKYICSCK